VAALTTNNSDMARQRHITDLPSELLCEHVFSKLDTPGTRVSSVCRGWYKLHDVVRAVRLRGVGDDNTKGSSFIRWLRQQQGPSPLLLDLHRTGSVPSDPLDAATSPPSLHPWNDAALLASIAGILSARRPPPVHSLHWVPSADAIGCGVDALLTHRILPAVGQSLRVLTGLDAIDEEGVEAAVSHCPRLETLGIVMHRAAAVDRICSKLDRLCRLCIRAAAPSSIPLAAFRNVVGPLSIELHDIRLCWSSASASDLEVAQRLDGRGVRFQRVTLRPEQLLDRDDRVAMALRPLVQGIRVDGQTRGMPLLCDGDDDCCLRGVTMLSFSACNDAAWSFLTTVRDSLTRLEITHLAGSPLSYADRASSELLGVAVSTLRALSSLKIGCVVRRVFQDADVWRRAISSLSGTLQDLDLPAAILVDEAVSDGNGSWLRRLVRRGL
jgi:hypothetical protein